MIRIGGGGQDGTTPCTKYQHGYHVVSCPKEEENYYRGTHWSSGDQNLPHQGAAEWWSLHKDTLILAFIWLQVPNIIISGYFCQSTLLIPAPCIVSSASFMTLARTPSLANQSVAHLGWLTIPPIHASHVPVAWTTMSTSRIFRSSLACHFRRKGALLLALGQSHGVSCIAAATIPVLTMIIIVGGQQKWSSVLGLRWGQFPHLPHLKDLPMNWNPPFQWWTLQCHQHPCLHQWRFLPLLPNQIPLQLVLNGGMWLWLVVSCDCLIILTTLSFTSMKSK